MKAKTIQNEPRAAIYLRACQSESIPSLESQQKACQECAARKGLDIIGVFTDADVSGATSLDDRPGLRAALCSLDRRGALLVAKRDRIVLIDPDSVVAFGTAIKAKRARVVSAAGEGTDDDRPESVLVRGVIDAFAEYEVRLRLRAEGAA